MQIKHQAVAQQMKKKALPLYVLIGQDTYLLEEAFKLIKASLKALHECDERVLSIQSPEEWKNLTEEANSYSLFSTTVLLNVLYDKKTLDAQGKNALNTYLSSDQTHCFTIIRAPNLPAKQVQWLSTHPHVVVVQIYPLASDAMKNWIATGLKAQGILFDSSIPALIHQYTQGNMLACAQAIEKISLIYAPNSTVSSTQVLEQLSNQCDHSLYELVDACLLGQADKAIQIVRKASETKTEATLVLWMLSQELRIFMQLAYLLEQKTELRTASAQLKIWPQRVNLYQTAMKRFKTSTLVELHRHCQRIDEYIKSSANGQIWNALECLAASISLGQCIS